MVNRFSLKLLIESKENVIPVFESTINSLLYLNEGKKHMSINKNKKDKKNEDL